MEATALRGLLFFVSGVLLDMGFFHVFNLTESTRHPRIARSRMPKLTSTIWGLAGLFLGGLISWRWTTGSH